MEGCGGFQLGDSPGKILYPTVDLRPPLQHLTELVAVLTEQFQPPPLSGAVLAGQADDIPDLPKTEVQLLEFGDSIQIHDFLVGVIPLAARRAQDSLQKTQRFIVPNRSDRNIALLGEFTNSIDMLFHLPFMIPYQSTGNQNP